jgi:hypothetical protein
MRSQIGADHYVSSLREGVEACLSVARSASEDEDARHACELATAQA